MFQEQKILLYRLLQYHHDYLLYIMGMDAGQVHTIPHSKQHPQTSKGYFQRVPAWTYGYS